MTRLKRLRGKGITELSFRARQQLAILRERASGLSPREMSDAAALRAVRPPDRGHSALDAARLMGDRIRAATARSARPGHNHFFPSLRYRGEIVATMQRRFPVEVEAIVARADRSIRGWFSLLGLADINFGVPCDWLLEPLSGRRGTLEHWSRIKYLDAEVAGDKKVTWELNRHQHFVTLGQAYWLTGDERYARAFASQVSSWMDANPPNRGINWASSLEVALRRQSYCCESLNIL
jgi:heparinase II/III-like protein